ncbi:hypothetical protein CROQUDRAFT_42998 [Cronartium quercuum f. sp. fusiforme G11]|uniref:Uncharacterized protein n=1 Tax=Cronartium quercuum f. sp. fusiforme G11 TaxID=708437 RepID=A0A9P6TCI4_9BASI|nr:hypothetical protein CROQUDRAFT_42998 [Cronartium quercuum f. sp. fusiforme G11]
MNLLSSITLVDTKALGHYLGKRPSDAWLKANSVAHADSNIQAAECACNTRAGHGQAFAYFEIDATKANNHGAPYGTCYAFTTVPKDAELINDPKYDVFFWMANRGQSGTGVGRIKNSRTGVEGYEDSHGGYHDGPNPNGDKEC